MLTTLTRYRAATLDGSLCSGAHATYAAAVRDLRWYEQRGRVAYVVRDADGAPLCPECHGGAAVTPGRWVQDVYVPPSHEPHGQGCSLGAEHDAEVAHAQRKLEAQHVIA